MENVSTFIDKIQSNPNVKSIFVKRCDLSDEFLSNELGECLKNSIYLSHLILHSCTLNDISIANICLGILQSESLICLTLKKNNIDNARAKTIAAGLSCNKVLMELNLENNDIRSTGCDAISVALADNQTLVSLTLSKNRIEDIDLLNRSVALHPVLRYLNLEDNNIGDAQADGLQHMLKKNHVLVELNLARNNIGDDGIKGIALGLARNFGLRTLILNRNSITDKSAESLAFALRHNNTLEVVDLDENNRMTALGAQNIYKGLEDNVTMLELRLSIHDSSPIMQDIRSVLQKNLKRKEGTHPDCFPSSISKPLEEFKMKRSIIMTSATQETLSCLAQWTRLTHLDLSQLSLLTVPPEIIKLTQLCVLDLRSNQLEHLTEDIERLRQLEILKLSDNNLHYLPYQLESMRLLRELHLWGNPLTQIPNHQQVFETKEAFHAKPFLQSGLVEYLRYLKKCNQESAEINKAKLMIVGNEKVGKTTLLRSLIQYTKKLSGKKQDALDNAYEPHLTDGITITDVEILESNESYQLSAWDFAGQDVYLTTHVFFLSPRTLYFVVFNLEEDLDNMEKVEYWIKSILGRAGKKVAIVLIGTHAESCKYSRKELDAIHKKLRNRYIGSVVNDILFVDSKKNSDKYMTQMCQKLLRMGKMRGYFGNKLPKIYTSVERRLMNLKKHMKRQTLSYKEFQELVMGCGIKSSEYLRIKEYLTQMGTILHFDKDERLRELVFIDPGFLCKIFADVISMKTQKSILAMEGIMPKRVFDTIWMGHDKKMRENFLRLLEMFEIAIPDYSKPEADRPLLIPSLLPENPPMMIRNYWNTQAPHLFQRIYAFKFLPYGFMDKLIVRVLQIRTLDIPCVWVNGLIARRDTESAKVEFEPKNFKLHVHVYGHEDSFLFLEILECVRGLIEAWFVKCDPKVLIPLDKGFVELGHIASLIRKGESTLTVDSKKIPIQNVAPDLMLKDMEVIANEELKGKVFLNAGGFGKVYSATYRGEAVAVKETHNEDLGNSIFYDDEHGLSLQALQEILHEAKIMTHLSKTKHRNLVQLKGIMNKPLGIVMELVDGQNLYSYLKDHGKMLSWNEKIKILVDIALGMDHLHRLRPPIVHGDLRSPNILITKSKDGHVMAKITDFGLSMQIYNKIGITQSQSFEWQAPEVFMDRGFTHASDIYSYAMIMWQVWKGSHIMPFEKERPNFSHHRDMQRAIDKKGLRPRIPIGNNPHKALRTLETLLRECWDGKPEHRPEFSRIVKELIGIAHELDLNVHENMTQHQVESQWTKYEALSTVKTWQQKLKIEYKSESGHATDMAYVDHLKQIWIGYSHSILKIYDLETKASRGLSDLTREYFTVSPSPSVQTLYNRTMEEKRIISIQTYNKRVWCISERNELSIFEQDHLHMTFSMEERGVCFIRHENMGLIGLENGELLILDLDALEDHHTSIEHITLKCIPIAKEPLSNILVHNNILWISHGKEIHIVCLQSLRVIHAFTAHNDTISSMVISPTNKHLWSCSMDRLVKVWSIESIIDNNLEPLDNPLPIKIFRQNENKVTYLLICGEHILSGGDALTIWDYKTFSIHRIHHHEGKVRKIIPINEDTVATMSVEKKTGELWDNTINIWERC